MWDGGDVVKCQGSGRYGLKVCNGGNSKAPLPSTCNPPHNFPSNWGNSGSYTVKCTPATCSIAQWWNCFLPSAWRQTCTIVYNNPKPSGSSSSVKPSTPASSAAASSAAASSAAASSAAASSAPASSAAASSAAPSDPASSAAASSAAPSDPASSAAASSAAPSDSPSPVSSAAPVQTSSVAVDPTQYPVCAGAYQQTYKNYTLVVPNGVWTGQVRGAATNDASYMTYTLAASPSDCLTACDQIEGCVFVNSYIDRNDQEADLPKHTPGVYTCAMFSKCVGTERNDNWGGQDDPNDILESNGYCKSGACSA